MPVFLLNLKVVVSMKQILELQPETNTILILQYQEIQLGWLVGLKFLVSE